MKPRSSIAKGKRMEDYVCNQLKIAGLDPRARRQKGSGSGLNKGDVDTTLRWNFEIKNCKAISTLQWVDQSKKDSLGYQDWAVIFRDHRTPEDNPEVYVTIDFWVFIELLKRSSEPLVKREDREFKWKVQNLKEAANKVLRHLKSV